MKALKFLVVILMIVFSFFFFIGFLLYVVYYIYTNYKKEVNEVLQKHPEISHVLRKTAAFTSNMITDKKLSKAESLLDQLPGKLTEFKKPSQAKVKAALKVKTAEVKKNLNSRQNKIIELLTTNAKLEMSEIKKNFPSINVRTVRRDLSALESMGRIVKTGKTKGAFYKLR